MRLQTLLMVICLTFAQTSENFAVELPKLIDRWNTEKALIDQKLVAEFNRQATSLKNNKALPVETRHRYLAELQKQLEEFQKNDELPTNDQMTRSSIQYLELLHQAAKPVREYFKQELNRTAGTPEFELLHREKEKWESRLPGRETLKSGVDFHGTRRLPKGNAIDFHVHIQTYAQNSFSGRMSQEVQNVYSRKEWTYEALVDGNRISMVSKGMLQGNLVHLKLEGYMIGRRIIMQITHIDGARRTGDYVSIWR